MLESDGRRDQLRILLYLLTAGLVFLVLGVGAHHYFGSTGLTVVDLTVSAILTAALVILYFRQTTILESQHDLLAQELNREARQQHTETLRERVRLWHGNPDREQPDDPLDHSGLNIPAVNRASFESAPNGSYAVSFPEEISFQVIPYQLDGDRYLEDLLQNHAPDLRETKEEIEQLQEDFVALREDFLKSFDADIVRETEDYTLESAGYFDRWMFDFLVRLEREDEMDFEGIRERVRTQIERGNTRFESDDHQIWISADLGGGRSMAVYSATLDEGAVEEGDVEELREYESEVEDETLDVLNEVVDRLETNHPYEQVVKAADVLDTAESAIDELEKLLLEYDGRPIYPGDCKYLEEARISSN
ncbi:hypothetical protein [Halomontanus rarus]|uniref:hypothetical protein n=1 Tax=Halomontanus rarus TaxID=3034020 RepID=UPI001A995A08